MNCLDLFRPRRSLLCVHMGGNVDGFIFFLQRLVFDI